MCLYSYFVLERGRKMAKLKRDEKEQNNLKQNDNRFKGTFASVMIVGGIIAGCWIFVFILFISRNGG